MTENVSLGSAGFSSRHSGRGSLISPLLPEGQKALHVRVKNLTHLWNRVVLAEFRE
jgi:hypothetical protein